MKIKEFIEQKVLEAGTQTAVSRKTGVSQGTIAKICSGDTKPEIDTIYKISAAYGINPAEFITAEMPNNFVNDPQSKYTAPLTPDEKAILDMLKGDPALARQVRRFTQFEKSAVLEDLKNDTTKAA